ncbi:hypothetical protein ACFL2W_00785 [Candidatus Omnitrophota bacterium]
MRNSRAQRITHPSLLVRTAQVTIEITFAFIVIFTLFYTSTKIFVWFCDSLANRQLAYEASRTIDHGAHPYPRNQSSWWQQQVKPEDVGYLDDYLNDPRNTSYYNAPLDLVGD